MCWWFFVLIIVHALRVLGHNKGHKCIHDELDHKISQQHVRYKNHPLHSADIQKRKLLQSTAYQPIRIRPYYDPTLINSYTLSDDQISYIKSLVSTSIHYLEQFVNVIPINGPLLIDRCQRVFEYDQFTYGACPLSDYIYPVKCQYATIPESHIAESWYYDPLTLQSQLYKEAGTGVADADLVIYVSYSNGQCAVDGSTLAWASICTLDQYGRPISGTINFCPGALETKYWKFDVGVTLHEIMHILAMSNTLFPYFYNWDSSAFYGAQNVVIESATSGLDNTYIVTDKVKEISRTHFGCDSLIGAPLENTGAEGTIGSHWESKYLQSELMCGTMYSAVLSLSDFTLALMEDTGWYLMDYEYSDTFTWGQNEGCAFFTADCVSKSTTNTNFDQYWCSSATDNGCSHDYSTSGQCVNQLSGAIPVQFRYYSDAAFGGPQSHDYCAFRYPVTNQMHPDYEHICWDSRGNTYSKTSQFPSVSFGINSRCVETSDGTNKNGHCFKHQCISYDAVNARYNAVQMIISDGSVVDREVITCSRGQSLQWTESSLYSVYIKCPNVDSLCGTSEKPFACYWGHWSSTLQKCICSVGYIGSECSIQDMDRFTVEAVAAPAAQYTVSLSSPSTTGLCITDSKKSVINGYYVVDGSYEGLPSYQKEHGSLHLYYLRYYAQWNIANSKGDLSIYAYCAEAISLDQYINIEECTSWNVWDESNGWVHDVGVHLFHCTPTVSPTPAPTTNPIPTPTFLPTVPSTAPSNAPSTSPILTPSDIPTAIPTTQPTEFPTDLPTAIPTAIPTEVPSYEPTMTPTPTETEPPTQTPTVYTTNRETSTVYTTTKETPTVYTANRQTTTVYTTNRQTPTGYTTTIPTMAMHKTTVNPTNTPTQETMEHILHSTRRNTRKPTEKETTYAATSKQTVSPSDKPIAHPSSSPTEEDIVYTSEEMGSEEILMRKHDNAYGDDNDSESEASYSFIVNALGCVVLGFALGFVCNRCIKKKRMLCCNKRSYWCPRLRGFRSISPNRTRPCLSRPNRTRRVFNDSDGDDDHQYDYAESDMEETDALNVYTEEEPDENVYETPYENPFDDGDADVGHLLHFRASLEL